MLRTAAPSSRTKAALPGVLLGASRFVMQRTHTSGPQQLPTWLLEMFVSGTLEIDIAGSGWRRFSAGDGVLYAPGTGYRERSPRGNRSASVCLFFELGDDPLLAPLISLVPRYRLVHDREGLLRALVEESVEAWPRSGVARWRAHGCFFQALAMLLDSASSDLHWTIQRERPTEDVVAQAQNYMRQHLHRPLRVDDLAKAVGLTPSGFAHAYRRLAGRSPMHDLRVMRIEAVKTHLLRRRLTLTQVAEEVGFADAFHLSHVFRQVTGQSPRDFRRALQHGAGHVTEVGRPTGARK